MYYKIKKNDVEKLFSIENFQIKLNKLIIIKYVNEGNVLKKETDDFKTQQEKQVAYLIINHDEIYITVKEKNTVENETHLLAALMADSDEVIIKIPDSKLQEDFKNQYSIIETAFREPNNSIINEDFLLGLTEDGWDNNEFIFKKLNSYKDSSFDRDTNNQLAIELVTYIPEDKWSDNNFVDMFFKNSAITKIFKHALDTEKSKTFELLFNKNILEKVIELNNSFLINHYAKIYQDYKSKDSYGSYSLKKDKNHHTFLELIEKEKEFLPEIQKYFKELEYVEKIINKINYEYFEMFDIQLRKNDNFKNQYITILLKHLEKQVSGSSGYIGSFTNLLGVDAFTDKRVQKFALEHGHKSYDSSYKPLLAAEIVKRDSIEIAEIISKGKGIDFLWDYFSKEQKQEKIIIKEILKQNPKIYNKLNESLKLDKEIFKIYYNQLENHKLIKDFKVGKINKSFFESFNEEEIIDLIKIIPSFLNEEKFPEMYFDNMKVMAHTNYDYYVFKELKSNERCQKTMKKIFDNKDLCMIMLEQNHNVFSLFSEKVIANMDILELYIKKSYQYDNLPPKVFLNKNILLNMLKSKPNFIEKIPAEYFKDQDFLLRIFDKIDKKELSEQVLTSLPTIINEVLNANTLTVGKYFDFFSKTFTNMNLTQKLEPGKKIKTKANKI